MTRTGSGVWVSSWTSSAVSKPPAILRPLWSNVKPLTTRCCCKRCGCPQCVDNVGTTEPVTSALAQPGKLRRVPVTEADFNLQGRVENYRERLFDRLVRGQLEAVNQERLGGSGAVSYETRPPRWTLSWRARGQRFNYEVNLMAFAQGGAWGIHGRMGLDRPFRNLRSVRERDEAVIRQEIIDQLNVDESLL